MIRRKFTAILLIFIFLFSVFFIKGVKKVKAESQRSQFCAVYFTAIGCANCAVTDPIVLKDWSKYDNLVVIEYMFRNWQDENASLLGRYVEKYGSWAAVPQLFIRADKVALGRIDVPNAENEIKELKSNKCLLLDGTNYFNELNLNEIRGNPLKIWVKGRLLIRVEKNNKVSSDFLRELLFSPNLSQLIEKTNYKIDQAEAEPAPISNGQIDFTKAIKIEDSWILEFNEEITTLKEETLSLAKETAAPEGKTQDQTIRLPLFGKINISGTTLPFLTLMIAGADGFNPCAFFIITFLLSTLLVAGSRGKIFLVGGIFVFFSGLIYFLFMSAWLNVFLFAKEILLLTIVAGSIAIVAGLINIKDYFFFKKGISLTLPTSQKLKLSETVKALTKSKSLLPLILGTVVLAVTINLYELLCTVGFPMIYTKILASSNLSNIQYYLYLIFYNIVYVIPLLFIVFISAITLGTRKFGEKGVRRLKLISGLMILLLGLVLILKPSLLENIFAAFGVLILAAVISGIVMTIKRV